MAGVERGGAASVAVAGERVRQGSAAARTNAAAQGSMAVAGERGGADERCGPHLRRNGWFPPNAKTVVMEINIK
ncbi:unnamed protein product [Miscanthus lutarioriparius]|uniref:Uncharacterized protein n=1 Tax=Miscanthus lutarioriparius TaxID=422564 RepID=A0A811NW76_9POAL|nr:unnamed protein product [Miscanthus lutarioriparius]